MARIGFIGPGIMGAPMARNLVAAGHDVRIWARSESARDRAATTGGEVVDSLSAAVKDAEVVITMVPAGPDVHAVVLGQDGLLALVEPGTLLIDCSTISPEESRVVHEAAAAAGVTCLDAPVSGGEAGAVEGNLSIMVGGSAEAFDAASDVLSAVGGTIVHVGGPGAGQVVKAANQMVVAGNLQILGEALTFLRAHGADLEAAFDVLGGGLAGSTVLTRKRSAMIGENYAPGFRIALHDKDMGIIAAAARRAGLALPVTTLVAQAMASALARGDGTLDHSALAKLTAELNPPPPRS